MITVFEFGCKDVVRVRVCLFVIRQKCVHMMCGRLLFVHRLWQTHDRGVLPGRHVAQRSTTVSVVMVLAAVKK